MEINRGSVLVALVSGDQIVSVRQPGKQAPIYWKLPGGRIKPFETPQEAAERETKEETGIDLTGIEISLLSTTLQKGRGGQYEQHLLIAAVPPELIAKHKAGIIQCIDDDEERLESTCFSFRELERMGDFLPKHREMILALKQSA